MAKTYRVHAYTQRIEVKCEAGGGGAAATTAVATVATSDEEK